MTDKTDLIVSDSVKTQLEQVVEIIEYQRDVGVPDFTQAAQQILDICQPQWRGMETAPKDGTHVLLKKLDGRCIVGRNYSDYMLWRLIGVAGVGGMPDNLFQEWMPIPNDTAS